MITIGLDLGGTKILAAAVEDGEVLDSVRVDTPQSGFEDVVDALVGTAEELAARGFASDAIGIGSPGPLDKERKKVIFSPNIAGLEDAPLVAALEERLGKPVVLENDANVAGYAEHLYGAARELHSSVYVTLSTGIGGGLFLGREVIRGAHGVAGEIGHMTLMLGGPMGGDGHAGTLEALAAGRSMARDASYAYSAEMDTRELFARARKGERKALGIVENAALFTGIGLANLVKVFDPEAFVLGGGLTEVGDYYLSRVQAAAEHYLEGYPVPPLRLAELGGEAGVIGAAAFAAAALEGR
ncbi:MAG: ROK family protein [Deinococcales bacterium]|nr:ROK family protein [Deinococcales bacterium]